MAKSHNDTAKALLFRLGLGRLYYNFWWINRARTHSPWLEWNSANKAVFIHVPKNAGSSIYKMFGITEPDETHCTAIGYRNSRPDLWRDCLTFAVVRNPWDRFVSAFHYLKQQPASDDDAAWAQRMLGQHDDFASFERAMLASAAYRSQVLMWRHFTPQWYFLCDFSGHLMVQKLARFERLDTDLGEIGALLNIPPQPARENVVARKSYQQFYSDAGRALIGQLYARDIALFSYAFEQSPVDLTAPRHGERAVVAGAGQ